jgi:hypothetical protein
MAAGGQGRYGIRGRRGLDVACGFDARMTAARCSGCWRSRAESPLAQLAGLDGLGAAAKLQADVGV